LALRANQRLGCCRKASTDTFVQWYRAAALAVINPMTIHALHSAATRALATLAFASLAACGAGPAQPPPPPVVTVAHPLAKNITDWDEYTGRIEPVEAVEVRARVSGYLQSVHFDEGGMVEEGDLLFVIDPRPYRAVLEQAAAELTRAQVRLELAGNDRDRDMLLARVAACDRE